MQTRIVLNAAGRIVNHIVVDDNTPANFSPGPGLTMSDVSTAPIDVPVLNEHGEPTGETATITVPIAIGGTYRHGVYTPPIGDEPL